MKNLISFGLLMLVLGFAIGWLVKPAPLSSAHTVVAAITPHKSTAANVFHEAPVPGKRAQREPAVKKPSDMSEEKLIKQMDKMNKDMSKAMLKSQRGKFEQLIDRLSESLNLSADQKGKITAWLDDSMKKFEGVDFDDPDSMSKLPKFSELPTNKALEDQLVPFLTNDQKAAFVDFKESEVLNQADTVALKSLSKLQGIMQLEDGQRDEIHKLLTADAEATARVESETPDIKKIFNEGLGIEQDPYDLGLEQAMNKFMSDDDANVHDGAVSEKQMAKNFREFVDKRIDAKVELLRPALNAKQLEQYRTELKTKGLGIYGIMLSGMEAGLGN